MTALVALWAAVSAHWTLFWSLNKQENKLWIRIPQELKRPRSSEKLSCGKFPESFIEIYNKATRISSQQDIFRLQHNEFHPQLRFSLLLALNQTSSRISLLSSQFAFLKHLNHPEEKQAKSREFLLDTFFTERGILICNLAVRLEKRWSKMLTWGFGEKNV